MASYIPEIQQAVTLESPGPAARMIRRFDVPVETPNSNEILVKITHTGIWYGHHFPRQLFEMLVTLEDKADASWLPPSRSGSEFRAYIGLGSYSPILGHEGVGVVVSHGPSVSPQILGKTVGIKWLYRSCKKCCACSQGFRHNCAKQLNTGRSCPGTLQQYVVADPDYVTAVPDDIPGEIAAPLLCAGLTMMGAIGAVQDGLSPGDWIVILGSGGGLGHIGVQIAARMRGLKVIGVDSGSAKRRVSLDSGAEAFIDYALQQDVAGAVTSLTGGEGAHALIVVPSSEAAFRLAPHLVRSRGIIACVGLPSDHLDIPIPVMLCIRKGTDDGGSQQAF